MRETTRMRRLRVAGTLLSFSLLCAAVFSGSPAGAAAAGSEEGPAKKLNAEFTISNSPGDTGREDFPSSGDDLLDPLTWAPPAGWRTFRLHTLTEGANTLDVNADYRLVIPYGHVTLSRGITINGGRNLVIVQPDGKGDYRLGGRITHAGSYNVDDPALELRAINWDLVNRPTVDGRIIHVEGVLFDGPGLNDVISGGDPKAIIQIQNVHVVETFGAQSLAHADGFQPYGTFKESRIDKFTIGATGDPTTGAGYQGLKLDTSEALREGRPARVQGLVRLRRVNIHGKAREAALLWWSETEDGPIRVDNGTVWLNHYGRSFVNGNVVFLKERNPGGAAVNLMKSQPVQSDDLGTYVKFPRDLDFYGRVQHRGWNDKAAARIYEGDPPGGDYCPPSVPGRNYVSPGYMSQQVR